jgi:SAM-dependent methyltransferase
MRNPETWRPTRLVKDSRSGTFRLNRRLTFGGSLYIAELQRKAYVPLIQQHVRGALLDVGCGPVPYYEVYREQVQEIVCVDYPGTVHGKMHLDLEVDLNLQPVLPFPDGRFDAVLATDMLPHMKRPDRFLAEVARLLKPGGKAIITSTFINWIGEFPYEYWHPTGPGLRAVAEEAGLQVIHLESFGGHADVLLDTLNKFFPQGFSNRLYLLFARLVTATGWPARNRKRTRDRYALGNAMVVVKP